MQIQEHNNNYQTRVRIDLQGFIKRFSFICNQIDNFTGSSEERFLTIGKSLSNYLNNSRKITSLASAVSESISDEILNKGITQLNTLLDEFRYFIKITMDEINNNRQELLNILPEVVVITEHLQGFDRIVKQLRMLGISTKIESARLGAEDQGFFALAETVDKLSGLINEKSKTILEKSNYLIGEIKKTSLNLANLGKDQSEQSSIIVNKIAHSSETFKLKYDRKAEKTGKISLCSADISKNINDIVTSIQFHDITRQRMEHSKSAIEELGMRINSDSFNENNYPDANLLGQIYDIITLQSNQIKDAVNEFNEAVIQIIVSLNGVEKNIEGMLSETVELVYEEDEEGKNSLNNVHSEINVITNGLKKNIEIGNELSTSINSVIPVVDDLSKYVMEIEDIGTEIELIALNARVKAARTGKNGSALGVLSETIQRLSVDAKSQTGSTSQVLNNISEKSKNLKINLEKGTYKKEGQNLILSTDKISDYVLGLMELEKISEKNIEKLSEDVNYLKNEINSTIKDLKVTEDSTNMYNNIKNEFEIISNSITSSGDYLSNISGNTHNLMKRYTMDNERKLHRNFTKNEELVSVENNSKINKNSLGDNVELF